MVTDHAEPADEMQRGLESVQCRVDSLENMQAVASALPARLAELINTMKQLCSSAMGLVWTFRDERTRETNNNANIASDTCDYAHSTQLR